MQKERWYTRPWDSKYKGRGGQWKILTAFTTENKNNNEPQTTISHDCKHVKPCGFPVISSRHVCFYIWKSHVSLSQKRWYSETQYVPFQRDNNNVNLQIQILSTI